jgi:beta-phosphoglucomutase-like phosphatase (HAD superfamily)
MDNIDVFCRPFPGAQQTVRDLKQKGYYLALTTANATETARLPLRVTNVFDYFDVVCGREICENPVTKVKDYSLVPLHTGKKTEECIVVEDSPVGVAGAKRGGFRCIAFDHYKDPVISELANIVVHNFNELRKIFGLPEINLTEIN